MASPHVDGGWLAAVLTALFGSGGILVWWSDREKARRAAGRASAAAEAEMVEATGHMTKDVATAAGEMFDHFRRELKVFSQRCDRLEASNGELKTKVDECDARHEDCERSLAQVRAEIAQLMRDNPPAGY